MASVIECDGCHKILKPSDPWLSIEKFGTGGWVVEEFGARNEFDVCSAECLAQLAANLLEREVPC